MLVPFDFIELFLVEVIEGGGIEPDAVGGFDQVVAQIAVPGFGHGSVVGGEVPRLVGVPYQARVFCKGVVGTERFDRSDFGQDGAREHRPDARDGN